MMRCDRHEEQDTLFKEIVYKKITVREAERIARDIAHDKIRKREFIPDPELQEIEGKFQEALGTRVQIQKRQHLLQCTIHTDIGVKINYFLITGIEQFTDDVWLDSGVNFQDGIAKNEFVPVPDIELFELNDIKNIIGEISVLLPVAKTNHQICFVAELFHTGQQGAGIMQIIAGHNCKNAGIFYLPYS